MSGSDLSAPLRPAAAGGHRPTRGRHPGWLALALAVAVAASTALAGCASSGDATGPAAQPPDEVAGDSAETGRDPGGTADTGTAVPAVPHQVVRTARITLQVPDLEQGSDRVRRIATDLGGQVAEERTTYGTGSAEDGSAEQAVTSTARAVVELRIPVARMDEALTRVTDLPDGTVRSRETTAEDVTADLADLDSRVATQRAGLERVRALLARTGSLEEIVALEKELTRRQADLEAAQARAAVLHDRADLATVTVTLRTVAPVASTGDGGFAAGFRAGGRALRRATVVTLTVFGALLPFLLVLAVPAVPAGVLLRRRARNRKDRS